MLRPTPFGQDNVTPKYSDDTLALYFFTSCRLHHRLFFFRAHIINNKELTTKREKAYGKKLINNEELFRLHLT